MNSRTWIVLTAGALSLAVMGGGGALALRTLGATEEPPTVATSRPDKAEEPGCCPNPGVLDKKAPAAFGLPSFPGAFAFHSMESEGGMGSVAFSLKQGSAAEVAGFYRKSLPERGWTMEWERPTTELTQVPGQKEQKRLPGIRQTWTHSQDGRSLQLLTIDYPQKRSKVQTVLSWAPAKGASAAGEP